jgi:hypothetical protein
MMKPDKWQTDDPTYVTAEIQANPVWAFAFRLSEIDNDNAPLGWSRYLPLARWLLATFEMTERQSDGEA